MITPAPARWLQPAQGGKVEVLTIELADADDAAWGLLSTPERERAARFRSARHARDYVSCHAALRRILAQRTGVAPEEIRYEIGPHGKPALAGDLPLRFNLARTSGLALCAIGHGCEVGVDVERTHGAAPVGDDLVERVCTPLERTLLASLAGPKRTLEFLRLWVRKEALVKLDGRGLALPLREVSGLDADGVVDLDVGAGNVAAVAT